MVLFARVAPASRGRFFGEIAMSQALGCYAKKNVCVCGLCCDENQILGWRVWIKRLSVEPHCTYTQGFWGTVDTAGAGIFFQKCVRQTHTDFLVECVRKILVFDLECVCGRWWRLRARIAGGSERWLLQRATGVGVWILARASYF